jgi:hypothetical protein
LLVTYAFANAKKVAVTSRARAGANTVAVAEVAKLQQRNRADSDEFSHGNMLLNRF